MKYHFLGMEAKNYKFVENYEKGEVKETEQDWSSLGLDFHSSVVHMRVSGGSKIRNLMGYAMKKMKEPEVQQITWNASGMAIGKAISCAEIMKRKVKGLHQVNKIRFHRIEEYWEPKIAELERLRVNRDLPAITILLSKMELDTATPGYQSPGSTDNFLQLRSPGHSDKRGDKRKPQRQKGGPDKSSKDSQDGANVSSWQRDNKKGKKKDSFNKQMQQRKQKRSKMDSDDTAAQSSQKDNKNADVPTDT